jgi:hypothetical protein
MAKVGGSMEQVLKASVRVIGGRASDRSHVKQFRDIGQPWFEIKQTRK